MLRVGEYVNITLEETGIRCRVERVLGDEAFMILLDSAALRLNKAYKMSIGRPAGIEYAEGLVVKAVQRGEAEKNMMAKMVNTDKPDKRIEYTIKLTKPFEKRARRMHYRLDCSLPATMSASESVPGNEARIIDISSGGARILSNSFFSEASEVNIKFKLDTKDISLFAKVLRHANAHSKYYKYAFSVCFTRARKNDMLTITSYVFSEFRKAANKKN